MSLFPDNRHDRSGYGPTTSRICPPHLRDLPVGYSYHHMFEPDARLKDLSWREVSEPRFHYAGAVTGRISHLKPNPSGAPKSAEPQRSANMVVMALNRGRGINMAKDLGELAVLLADDIGRELTRDEMLELTSLKHPAIHYKLDYYKARKAQRAQRAKIAEQTAREGLSRAEFDKVVEAIWSELEYQNNLPRRTADEAKDTAGFATLGRTYLRKLEDHWTMNPGEVQPEGNVAVTECLHDLRKLAAIFVRAMIYCGIRSRS